MGSQKSQTQLSEHARILPCQLFQLLLSSPILYLILAYLEGLESPGSNQSTCFPTLLSWSDTKGPSSQSQLPHPFPLLLSSQKPWVLAFQPSNFFLSTWGLQNDTGYNATVCRSVALNIHASIVSQSFSLLEIFIISLLNNLYFVFSLVFSLPVPSTAIPFYFFSYSILIKIILSILPKIWHKILWKKETPQLVLLHKPPFLMGWCILLGIPQHHWMGLLYSCSICNFASCFSKNA